MSRRVPTKSWTVCLFNLVLALTACGQAGDSPFRPDDTSVQMSHGSSEMTPEYEQQLAQLRSTTAPFHNVDMAAEAGYDAQLTPCWYYSGLGAMGYHYGNLSLIDATAQLLAPEILVYEPMRGGGLRLVALEYIVPINLWPGPTPPSLLGQEFHRNDALGLYALHIWLWRHNPSGTFEHWNPDVSCQYASDSEDRAP